MKCWWPLAPSLVLGVVLGLMVGLVPSVYAALPHVVRGTVPLRLSQLVAVPASADRVLLASPAKGWRQLGELLTAAELSRWQLKGSQPIYLELCQSATAEGVALQAKQWLQRQYGAALRVQQLTRAGTNPLPCDSWGRDGKLRPASGAAHGNELRLVDLVSGKVEVFRLAATHQVWRTNRALPAAAVLSPDALRSDWVAFDPTSYASAWQPDDASRYRLRQPVAANAVLKRQQVQPHALVQSGDAVELTLISGSIELVSTARALEAGELGQWVQVLPASAARAVKARVVATGKVQIDE